VRPPAPLSPAQPSRGPLELGDYVLVDDAEHGELLFRVFHFIAKPDGLHDVRAVKEDELDYIVPSAEEEPIFLRRNRDGSLDFPPDVRPAPASAAQGAPERSRDAQSGALVWAFAFEELGPSSPSSSALSLPGPGGVWRTAVVRRERRDRFTYQRCLVAPDGRQWRGSQLRQLAEHLFDSRPEQLRQALYMLNLPPGGPLARETGEESEGGAASGAPSSAVAGALPQELDDAAPPPPPPPPPAGSARATAALGRRSKGGKARGGGGRRI